MQWATCVEKVKLHHKRAFSSHSLWRAGGLSRFKKSRIDVRLAAASVPLFGLNPLPP